MFVVGLLLPLHPFTSTSKENERVGKVDQQRQRKIEIQNLKATERGSSKGATQCFFIWWDPCFRRSFRRIRRRNSPEAEMRRKRRKLAIWSARELAAREPFAISDQKQEIDFSGSRN